MFENILILISIHAAFVTTGALFFLPPRALRWGGLWMLQILITEWPFIWFLSLAFMSSADRTFLVYLPLGFVYLGQRKFEFKTSDKKNKSLKVQSSVSLTVSLTLFLTSLGQDFLYFIFPFPLPISRKIKTTSVKLSSSLTHDFHQTIHSQGLWIHIHGGAWIHGDSRQLFSSWPLFQKFQCDILSLNYLKLNQIPLDEICETLTKDLEIVLPRYEGQRVVLYGRSAGAHLALTLAQRFPQIAFEVVALYPITDLKSFYDNGFTSDILNTPSLVKKALNVSNDTSLTEFHFEKSKNLSPLHSITNLHSRYFLIHGQNDPVVAVQQSDLLYQRILELRGEVQYLRFRKGTHGFDGLINGLSMRVFKKHLAYFLDGVKS